MHPITPKHYSLPCPLLLPPSGHPPPFKVTLTLKFITHSFTSLFFTLFPLMNHPVADTFTHFYHNWVWKLEEILHQLLQVSKQRTEVLKTEQELQVLVSKVTSHLKEYYTVKWASAHEDVLVFFSPAWLSPLENAYLWITGWKPSMVFKLLETLEKQANGGDFVMAEEQVRKIEELRKRTRMEEEKVEREMERQQVAMADRKMVELVKLAGRARNNDGGGSDAVDAVVEVALKGVLAGLERVMKASDCVRLKTLKGVLDVLSPMQCVDFLALNIAMQLRLRQWGKKKMDIAAAGSTLNVNQDNLSKCHSTSS